MVVLDEIELNEKNFDNISVMAESDVSTAFVGKASPVYSYQIGVT